MIEARALWELKDAIARGVKASTSGYQATYSHKDADGTHWVTIQGSEEPVPATGLVTSDIGEGDSIRVSLDGGSVSIIGNDTNPSVGATNVLRMARIPAAEVQQRLAATIAKGKEIADQAKRIAEAVGQHVWTADDGLHLTEVTEDEFTETPQGRNMLLNAYGFLLREAETWLASFTEGATAFYDGLGNAAENIITSIGKAGATIGYAAGRHVTVNDDGMTVYSQDGVDVFDISAIGAPHAEQVLYQIKEIEGYAEGTSSVSGLDTQSPTRQQEPGARKLVGWWDGSDYTGFNWNRPLKLRVIATVSAVGLDADGNTITAEEQLLDDVLDVSIGNSTVSIGDGSILLEYTGGSFFLYQLYATVTGAYLQDESSFVSYNATTTLKVVSGGYMASGSVLRPTMRFGSSAFDGPSGPYSVALGWRVLAQAEAQAAFGRFNANDPDNAFEIGNGTADDARSNALAVGWDGTLYTARDTDTTTVSDVLTAASGVTIGAVSYIQRGGVAALFVRASRSAATSGATVIGTLVAGKRPVMETAAPAPLGNGDVFVAPDGKVTYRPSGTVAAGSNLYIRITYLVA